MGIKISEADKQFSLAVRMSAKWKCEHCGLQGGPTLETKKMECCHLIGRRNASTRWDTFNAICMCTTCHRTFTEEPKLFADFITAYYGPKRWDILYEKKRAILKNNQATRKEVAAHYRAAVKRLAENEDYEVVSWI